MGINASLCMVGPVIDNSFQEVKDLAATLEVDIEFTGKLTKQEWIELSQDYNIFINTTNVDNTPVSVIEAMALGLPVVSTNVGGMPFLIQNKVHGLLVEKNNVDAMVEAIVTVIQSTNERVKIIKNARLLAESFDWERVKNAWKKVLA